MERILFIETSTALCSTALSEDGKIVSRRENAERKHASLTAPFIKEMLDEQGLAVRDCNAVCVSMGPGSYTGLRVGVSTAKGLCFGAGLPLLAVGSLDTLVWQAIGEKLLPEGCKYIVPMIDARRMEVYTQMFDSKGNAISDISAEVVTAESFAQERQNYKNLILFGSGAAKCSEILGATMIDITPSVRGMARIAESKYRSGEFVDVAYFEPYYLKDFVVTTSKKNLLFK